MARDIDRKLRLTAALLGTTTRKDLATAFRKVNPATSFDVGRADKWLQGRARPREATLYEDWARVLEIERPGNWIAECDVETFVAEIAARHGRDADELRRRSVGTSGAAGRSAPGLDLAGTYVCYSHAWSPYFRGRLVRGEMVVGPASGINRFPATYTELLPTGPMVLEGTGALSKNDLRFELHDASGTVQLLSFCLFAPKPPASVLVGYMFGTALMGPDAQPSMTRLAMVRLPGPVSRPPALDAYLPDDVSLAADLAAFGLDVEDRAATDRCLADLLRNSSTGVDVVPLDTYRALVDIFDRTWLATTARPPVMASA